MNNWSKYGKWRHTEDWYVGKLNKWMIMNAPAHMKSSPCNILSITDDHVMYGIDGVDGILSLPRITLDYI